MGRTLDSISGAMFAFNFRNLVMAAGVCWRLAVPCALVLGAAGCGQLPPPSPVTGATGAGAAASAAVVPRDAHTPYFPVSDGTNHAAQVCSDCHQSDSTFTDYTCVSCHDHSEALADMRHTYITGFVFQSSACFSCHPTGNEAAITVDEHSNKYFTINDDAHGSLACGDCPQAPTTSKPFTCLSCHDHSQQGEAMNHDGVSGYSYDSNACFSCHQVTTAPTDASTN